MGKLQLSTVIISQILITLTGLSFIVGYDQPMPNPLPKCKTNEFLDEVAFDCHSCNVCSMREGSMFRKQCESVCNFKGKLFHG